MQDLREDARPSIPGRLAWALLWFNPGTLGGWIVHIWFNLWLVQVPIDAICVLPLVNDPTGFLVLVARYVPVTILLHRIGIRVGRYRDIASAPPTNRKPTLGKYCALNVLRLARAARRLERRLFEGTAPQWYRDLQSLIKYLNVLALVPTAVTMIGSPDHFFHRIASIASGKKKIYKTPINFLTSSVSQFALIIVFGFSFFGVRLDRERVFEILFIAAIGTPLSMIVLCAATQLIYSGNWFVPWWFKHIDSSLTRLDPEIAGRILSLRTYRSIDKARFLWSLPYFAVFTFFGMALTLACTALSWLVLFSILIDPCGNDTPMPAGKLAAMTVCASFVWAQRIVLYPYTKLLKAVSMEPKADSAQLTTT